MGARLGLPRARPLGRQRRQRLEVSPRGRPRHQRHPRRHHARRQAAALEDRSDPLPRRRPRAQLR
eukprot:7162019-Pyramimonas_sp.AAC.1